MFFFFNFQIEQTPFHCLCAMGNLELIKILLESDTNNEIVINEKSIYRGEFEGSKFGIKGKILAQVQMFNFVPKSK